MFQNDHHMQEVFKHLENQELLIQPKNMAYTRECDDYINVESEE